VPAISDFNLVFLGAPGAGKGTQTKKLISKYQFVHLSTGDLLRRMIKENHPLGILAKSHMDQGHLVPDDLIIEIMKSKMLDPKGYIFDGFPRTEAQARALDEIANIDKVIFLEVAREDLIKRLTGRRICKNCGHEYHIYFRRSSSGEKCDKCEDGTLYQRDDDKEDVIKKRLSVFEQQTKALIDYYQDKLLRVDGSGTVDEIFSRIEEKLKPL